MPEIRHGVASCRVAGKLTEHLVLRPRNLSRPKPGRSRKNVEFQELHDAQRTSTYDIVEDAN